MQARAPQRIKGVGTVAQLKSDHQGFTQVRRERRHTGIRAGEHVVNVVITGREQLKALPQIGACNAVASADLDRGRPQWGHGHPPFQAAPSDSTHSSPLLSKRHSLKRLRVGCYITNKLTKPIQGPVIHVRADFC